MGEAWMKCTECRIEIAYGVVYWQCSVSTCNRSRMPMYFCSVACWDSHLSTVRHRDAYAVEVRAPSKETWQREQDEAAAAPPPRAIPATPDRPPAGAAPMRSIPAASLPAPAPVPMRRVAGEVVTTPAVPSSSPSGYAPSTLQLSDTVDRDVLIVVSKLKKYIKDRSGMNCSDAVMDLLSDHVRAICDESIRTAARDERKTVLERDVPRPRR